MAPFGFGGRKKRFLSELRHRDIRSFQISATPQTLQLLQEHGVDESAQLKLEYFFYTNHKSKADGLAKDLRSKGYSVEVGRSASEEKTFLITGWTDKMAMNNDSVADWAGHMCDLGFQHDCEFDGWGTDAD